MLSRNLAIGLLVVSTRKTIQTNLRDKEESISADELPTRRQEQSWAAVMLSLPVLLSTVLPSHLLEVGFRCREQCSLRLKSTDLGSPTAWV